MATFTPPNYYQPIPKEKAHDALWRYFDGIPVGYTVIITSSVVTPYPGTVAPTEEMMAAADSGSGHGGKAVFIGGHGAYTITSGEKTILDAAGYTTV